MNKKVSILFLLITILAITVPTAHAAIHDDDWFTEKTITGAKALHPEIPDTSSVYVEPFWHDTHGGVSAEYHKHIRLNFDYGLLYGRVLFSGILEEISYTYDPPVIPDPEPEPEPIPPTKIYSKTIYSGPIYHWNGHSWVYNVPVSVSTRDHGKIYLTATTSDGLYVRTFRVRGVIDTVCLYLPLGVSHDVTWDITPR